MKIWGRRDQIGMEPHLHPPQTYQNTLLSLYAEVTTVKRRDGMPYYAIEDTA